MSRNDHAKKRRGRENMISAGMVKAKSRIDGPKCLSNLPNILANTCWKLPYVKGRKRRMMGVIDQITARAAAIHPAKIAVLSKMT